MKKNLRTGILTILLTLVLSLIASPLARLFLPGGLYISEPLHSALEIMGAFAALSLSGLIVVQLRYRGYSSENLWLACGLIGMGILDAFHAVVLPGNSFVWLHSLSTFIGGFFFFLTFLLPYRKIKRRTAFILPFSVGALSIITGALYVSVPGLVPEMLSEGNFTLAAKIINTLAGFFFLSASGNFFGKYLSRKDPVELIFSSLCLLFGMANLLFFFSSLWDAEWWLWHVFRVTAYLVTLPFTFFLFRRIERELENAVSRLKSSNAELENFAYSASHDLKDPLLAIASDLKLLEKRNREKLDPDSYELVADARDMALQMEKLISDLLAYSRIGAQIKFEPTDCNAVLKRAVENLRIPVEKNGAEVTSGPLPEIKADSLELVKLFQNLIGNGIKFRRVEPPRIHVSAKRQENGWMFSVTDNGIGIPPEDTGRVFEIFSRLHKDYPGTGMGLAICKKIVERHGGNIWAESEPGKGSTFYFTIPDRD